MRKTTDRVMASHNKKHCRKHTRKSYMLPSASHFSMPVSCRPWDVGVCFSCTSPLCNRLIQSFVLVLHSEAPASSFIYGRAIAQAVSRRLSTSAVRVQSQTRPCEICGGQSSTGADFLRVLRFPLQILISPITPHSSSIIRG
jgi:hypothetical protein